MISAEEITTFINDLVREEHGMPMTKLTDQLVDTGIDSFGIVMVLMGISNEYNVYNKDELSSMDIPSLTLSDMIKRIQDESSK